MAQRKTGKAIRTCQDTPGNRRWLDDLELRDVKSLSDVCFGFLFANFLFISMSIGCGSIPT